MQIRTRPLSIRYIASPFAPWRKRRVSWGQFCSESRLRKSFAASSSSEAKSGTDRSASRVIWEVTFDMTSFILTNNPSILHQDNSIREGVSQFVIVRNHKNSQRIVINHFAQQGQ